MKIVFMGTPDFAVGILKALIETGQTERKRTGRSVSAGKGMCVGTSDSGITTDKDKDTGGSGRACPV